MYISIRTCHSVMNNSNAIFLDIMRRERSKIKMDIVNKHKLPPNNLIISKFYAIISKISFQKLRHKVSKASTKYHSTSIRHQNSKVKIPLPQNAPSSVIGKIFYVQLHPKFPLKVFHKCYRN